MEFSCKLIHSNDSLQKSPSTQAQTENKQHYSLHSKMIEITQLYLTKILASLFQLAAALFAQEFKIFTKIIQAGTVHGIIALSVLIYRYCCKSSHIYFTKITGKSYVFFDGIIKLFTIPFHIPSTTFYFLWDL